MFACGQCKGVEFQSIVHILTDENGRAKEIAETGMVKCSDCAARYEVAEDRSIILVETTTKGPRTPRVRSSVSAAERGKDHGGTSKF